MPRGPPDTRVYVGNLPPDIRRHELEDIFRDFGRINHIDLKSSPGRGPPFAFLEFDDVRDADDAIKYRDGYKFENYTLRVEFPRGSSYNNNFRNFRGRGGRSGPPSRRSIYRVRVTGLPSTGSWQDLKDHMREAGDVCYADVYKDGSGVVEYLRYDDMKYACRKLDDTKFKSHEGDTAYVRVAEDKPSRSRSRSRSRSPLPKMRDSRRRSPSYSPRGRSKSFSRSRSRSKSP